MNSKGPSTEPYRTPLSTGYHLDISPFTTTLFKTFHRIFDCFIRLRNIDFYLSNRAYQTLRKAGHISWKDTYPSRPALGYATVITTHLEQEQT